MWASTEYLYNQSKKGCVFLLSISIELDLSTRTIGKKARVERQREKERKTEYTIATTEPSIFSFMYFESHSYIYEKQEDDKGGGEGGEERGTCTLSIVLTFNNNTSESIGKVKDKER